MTCAVAVVAVGLLAWAAVASATAFALGRASRLTSPPPSPGRRPRRGRDLQQQRRHLRLHRHARRSRRGLTPRSPPLRRGQPVMPWWGWVLLVAAAWFATAAVAALVAGPVLGRLAARHAAPRSSDRPGGGG